MPKDCLIGKCSETVRSDSCVKAVSLDKNGGLHAPKELRDKFGSMPRCDYYLVAKDGDVLVLIEKTDLASSIEEPKDKSTRRLLQIFKFNIRASFMDTANNPVYRELIYNKICAEHREKALATLYISEHLRQCEFNPNLRCILKYKRVLYVLLFPRKLKRQHVKILPRIRKVLQSSLIKEKDFHFTEEKNFCRYMSENKLA